MSTIARRLTAALVVVAILSGPIAAFGAPTNAPSFVTDTAHAAAAVHRRTNHVPAAAEAEGTPAAGGDLSSSTQDENSPPTEELPPTGDNASGADAAPPPAEVPSDPSGEEPPAETATDPADVVGGEPISEPVPTEQPPVDASTDKPTTAPEPSVADLQADVDEDDVESLAANQPPVANDDSYGVAQGGILTVDAATGVLANDSDADNDGLTAQLVTGPAHAASLTLNPDGAFVYDSIDGFNGTDTFTYEISDGVGGTDQATVTIEVIAPNNVPVAHDDAFTTPRDTALTVGAPGLLGNDFDADVDPLTAQLDTAPTNGTVTVEADGSFIYTPNPGFVGTDTFGYVAFDGTDGDGATVTIEVPDNGPPVANDDAYEVGESQTLTVDAASGFLANDTDPDGDTLSVVFELGSGPAHGNLRLVGTGGGFQYIPGPDFSGTDSFQYHARDGALSSNVATVTITVVPNTPPVATDDAFTTDDRTQLVVNVPGLLANDADADADALTAVLLTPPANGDAGVDPNGSFFYSSDIGFLGTDSFTYQISDGRGGTDQATVTITVGPFNEEPQVFVDHYSAVRNTALTVDAAAGVLANDTDLENSPLTAILNQAPTHGQLTLNDDGSFVYVPAPGFTGGDTFTYHAFDGEKLSAFATVFIAVEIPSINLPPVANDDAYEVGQDSTLTVDAPGVIANDTDPEREPLGTLLETSPAHGTLGTLGTLGDDGSFTYTPAAGFVGTDSFTYTVFDHLGLSSDVATVTITVTEPDEDAPLVANDDAFTTQVNQALVMSISSDLLGNDEGFGIALESFTQPAHGSVGRVVDDLVYTPASDYTGPDSFTYRIGDGIALSNFATVMITVSAPTGPISAGDDEFSMEHDTTLSIPAPGVLTNDTGFDTASPNLQIQSLPTQGSVDLLQDGSFNYTPNPGFSGIDTFTYSFGVSPLSATGVVRITVSAPPAPSGVDDAFSVEQDSTLTVDSPGVLANDIGVNPADPTASITGQPQFGSATMTADGAFTYTPNASFIGDDRFSYRFGRGALSAVAFVNLTVTASVNDPPVAVDDAFTAIADAPFTVNAPGLLANDVDADDDLLTVADAGDPDHGTVLVEADGAFTYTPEPGFIGTTVFAYTVVDHRGGSDTAEVAIAVGAAANTPPVGGDDAFTVAQDTDLIVAAPGVLANDADADDDPLVASVNLGDLPQHGAITLDPDGGFTYTPEPGFVGLDSFSYAPFDPFAAGNLTQVDITVSAAAANTPPVANDDTYTTAQDTPLTVDAPGVLANDTDADGQTLVVSGIGVIQHGTVTPGADGSFDFVPEPGFVGTASFQYIASDGVLGGESNLATVTIVVGDTADDNTPPVAADDAYAVAQDVQLTVPTTSGLLANDSDADGDALTIEDVADPQNGTVSFSADGSFTYTPDSGFIGSDIFGYVSFDGRDGHGNGIVEITVEAASPSPEPSPQPSPSPEPSPDPSPAPSPPPSPSPSPDPSPEPSPDPSTDPSPEPDTSPSPASSDEPSSEPPVTTPDQSAPDGTTEPTEPGEPANEKISGTIDSTAPDGSHFPAPAESGPNPQPAESAYDVDAFPNTGAGEAAQSNPAGPPLWLTICLALAILALASAGAAIHRRSSH